MKIKMKRYRVVKCKGKKLTQSSINENKNKRKQNKNTKQWHNECVCVTLRAKKYKKWKIKRNKSNESREIILSFVYSRHHKYSLRSVAGRC